MRQLSILQVVTTSHFTLHQFNSFAATHDNGDIFEGLGSSFGKAISAITHGGSEVIKAAGHGAKEGLEGLAEFSEKVARGMAETTGTFISSIGDAIHDVGDWHWPVYS